MSIDTLRVNGNLVSWASTIFKIYTDRFTGLVSIGWDDKRERVPGYGMNRSHAPIGRTSGKYTPGIVKVKMHKHAAIDLRFYLANLAVDGRSYGNAIFPMYLQYVESDLVSTVEFFDCATTGETCSDEESPDPRFEEWEFSTLRIRKDGLTLYDSSEEG
jgi:hypothetical protein